MTKKDIRANSAVLIKEGTDKALVLENKIKEFSKDSYSVSENNYSRVYTIHDNRLNEEL